MRNALHTTGRPMRGPSPAAASVRGLRNAFRRGFTLIEAAMVTVIIGIGVVGMLELLAAGTLSNSKGTELTTAINLANNVREISLGLAFADPQQPTVWNTKEATIDLYDDIKDLDGCQWSPPLDVRRREILSYGNWRQKVLVQTVDPNMVGGATRPNDPTSPTARITVTIEHKDTPVYTMSWLAVAPKAN